MDCLRTVREMQSHPDLGVHFVRIETGLYADFTAAPLVAPLQYFGFVFGLDLRVHLLPPYQFEHALNLDGEEIKPRALLHLWDEAKMSATGFWWN